MFCQAADHRYLFHCPNEKGVLNKMSQWNTAWQNQTMVVVGILHLNATVFLNLDNNKLTSMSVWKASLCTTTSFLQISGVPLEFGVLLNDLLYVFCALHFWQWMSFCHNWNNIQPFDEMQNLFSWRRNTWSGWRISVEHDLRLCKTKSLKQPADNKNRFRTFAKYWTSMEKWCLSQDPNLI